MSQKGGGEWPSPPLPLFAYCQIYVNREKEMQEKEQREIVSEQNVIKKLIDLSKWKQVLR